MEYVGHIARGHIQLPAPGDGPIPGFVEIWPGHIDRLFVSPDAAGQGIGGRQLRVAMRRAFSDGRDRVRIEATVNAERFYSAHGFRTLGPGGFTQPSGARIETVLMEMRREDAELREDDAG